MGKQHKTYLFNGEHLTFSAIARKACMHPYAVKRIIASLSDTHMVDIVSEITPEHWERIKTKKRDQLFHLSGSTYTIKQLATLTKSTHCRVKTRIEKHFTTEQRHSAHNNNTPIDVFELFFFSTSDSIGICTPRKGNKALYLVNGGISSATELAKENDISIDAVYFAFMDKKVA